MTDHHDELASAYLDGHVSPEEAARVESDPQLMAEVEALAAAVDRLQSEEAPVDAATRHRHLSAALAAFDALGPDESSAPTNVISLESAAGRSADRHEPTAVYPQPDDMARRTARVASASGRDGGDGARRARTHRRQGLPSWLGAAAALLLVGGGIGWFMNRQDRSDETAAVTFSTDSAGAGAASDAALSQAAEAGGADQSTAAGSETAKADVENAAGTVEAQEVAPAPADGSASATSAAAAELSTTTSSRAVTSAAPASTTPTTPLAPGGLSFSSTPTGAEVLARLTSTGQSPQPPDGSSCGGVAAPPAGTVLSGYVPLTVGGVAGEGLVYRPASGSGASTVLVVRTASCQAFS